MKSCGDRNCHNDIIFDKLLGRGSFGLVYEGRIKKMKIAIKELPFVQTVAKDETKKYSGMFGQSKEKSKIEIE